MDLKELAKNLLKTMTCGITITLLAGGIVYLLPKSDLVVTSIYALVVQYSLGKLVRRNK